MLTVQVYPKSSFPGKVLMTVRTPKLRFDATLQLQVTHECSFVSVHATAVYTRKILLLGIIVVNWSTRAAHQWTRISKDLSYRQKQTRSFYCRCIQCQFCNKNTWLHKPLELITSILSATLHTIIMNTQKINFWLISYHVYADQTWILYSWTKNRSDWNSFTTERPFCSQF